jgi:DNA-binding CsgD family transcriptional regulator
LIRAHRPAARLSDATAGRLERSFRYREAMRPRGYHFDLRCAYAVRGEHWGGITLLRERGRPDFSDGEVALLRRLAPHLGAGQRAATLRALDAADTPSSEASGVLILDARGRVVQHTLAAERWLGELGELGTDWREGRDLPDPVWLAVAALRRALQPQTERDRTRVPCVQARTRGGRWLEVQASRGEARDGRVGDVVVILAPVGPRELTWLRTAAYELSAREQEVVDLVVRGASTRQIAARLCIAEYTVQDHLKHVFDKVGVRGRRALVKRLYLDGQMR